MLWKIISISVFKTACLQENAKICISQYLSSIAELVGRYYVSDIDTFMWIQNPFYDIHKIQSLSLKEKEQLIDIAANFESRMLDIYSVVTAIFFVTRLYVKIAAFCSSHDHVTIPAQHKICFFTVPLFCNFSSKSKELAVVCRLD